MSGARAQTGFTLIEMLVSLVVVSLVLGAAFMGFSVQNQSLHRLQLVRASSATLRDAMLQLEANLRRAGFGVDPRFALDMSYRCITSTGPCRDRTTGPDELAFVARNPLYRWRNDGEAGCATPGGCFDGNAFPITAYSSAAKTITATLPVNAVLEKGRVVLATCIAGQNPVFLTLGQRHVGAGADVTLNLAATDVPPYHMVTGLQACHNQVGAALFLVDRFRYYVGTINSTPWLMLDTGLDLDGDGLLPASDVDDIIPIAENIEDLQVATILRPSPAAVAPDSNGNWVLGDDKGSTSYEEPNRTKPAPDYQTPYEDPLRFNTHPANVRAVRVTLIARTSRTDPTKPANWPGDVMPGQENRAGNLSGGRFQRFKATSEVTLRNMDSTNSFIF